MRITLIKYISKEIWSIFLTCLFIFLFIIMASQVLNMMDFMVNYGASLGDILSVMFCRIPEFILFAMPIACLTAVLLSFIRMSSDNEIIALHSSGISLYQLMSPVIIFALTCFLFTGFLTLYWTPYGKRTSESVEVNLMKTSFESQIKEGFNEREGFVSYVSSYSPKDKIMRDVFFVVKIEEKEATIVAKQAKFINKENEFYIRLTDFKMLEEGENGESHFLASESSTDFQIPIDSIVEPSEGSGLEPEGMYLKH